MRNIIYPQIGNAAQHGIFLALSKKMNLKDAIKESQFKLKYSIKRLSKKNLSNCNNQLASIIKRGFIELSALGKLKSYQKSKKIIDSNLKFLEGNKWLIKKNISKKRDIRFDFEFNPINSKNILLELKVVWKKQNKIPKKIQKQLITYSQNSRKRCIICFLVVKIFGKKSNYINTFPEFFELKVK